MEKRGEEKLTSRDCPDCRGRLTLSQEPVADSKNVWRQIVVCRDCGLTFRGPLPPLVPVWDEDAPASDPDSYAPHLFTARPRRPRPDSGR